MEPGEFHLIVHVCIFNPRGEMLIQQRELSEELGIQVELQATRPHMTINFPKGFDDVYVVEKDVALSALELQFAEVQDVYETKLEKDANITAVEVGGGNWLDQFERCLDRKRVCI